MSDNGLNYYDYVEDIKDFPKPGINFKDISPLLKDFNAFGRAILEMSFLVKERPKYWVGADARGFIFASALAAHNQNGIIMCRKKGKLPPPTLDYSYTTEYSEDTLEIKEGSGDVYVVDDVLATGGTLQAMVDLCKNAGYNVTGAMVLMDLKYVPRVSWFDNGLKVQSLLSYE